MTGKALEVGLDNRSQLRGVRDALKKCCKRILDNWLCDRTIKHVDSLAVRRKHIGGLFGHISVIRAKFQGVLFLAPRQSIQNLIRMIPGEPGCGTGTAGGLEACDLEIRNVISPGERVKPLNSDIRRDHGGLAEGVRIAKPQLVAGKTSTDFVDERGGNDIVVGHREADILFWGRVRSKHWRACEISARHRGTEDTPEFVHATRPDSLFRGQDLVDANDSLVAGDGRRKILLIIVREFCLVSGVRIQILEHIRRNWSDRYAAARDLRAVRLIDVSNALGSKIAAKIPVTHVFVGYAIDNGHLPR